MTDPNVRQVRVRWTGEGLAFEGGPADAPSIVIDSDLERGPSPTHLFLMALAGCMGVDVKMILEKSRVPIEAIEVEAVGVRAEEAPRRFLKITLTYELERGRGGARGSSSGGRSTSRVTSTAACSTRSIRPSRSSSK